MESKIWPKFNFFSIIVQVLQNGSKCHRNFQNLAFLFRSSNLVWTRPKPSVNCPIYMAFVDPWGRTHVTAVIITALKSYCRLFRKSYQKRLEYRGVQLNLGGV